MGIVLYKSANAGCIQLLVEESWSCSSCLTRRAFLLQVKSRVGSDQKRVVLSAQTSVTKGS